MSRFDAPCTAFRLWWREASNGSRSKAVATGAAIFAFVVWITVPSGGVVLTSFAAGFPTSATTRPGSAVAAPAAGQGTQLASSAADLAPSAASPATADLSGDTSAAASTTDSGASATGPGDSGVVPGGPGPNGQPGPTTSGSTCPVSFPSTGTPLDGLAAQLSALCAQVLAGAGSVPTGSLPGGGSGAAAVGDPPQMPMQWLYLDGPVGTSGTPAASRSPAVLPQWARQGPTVQVGLVQASPVSPALTAAIGDLAHRGALVQLVLVPTPAAAGGAPAFASWVTKVLAALPTAPLVEIGAGAAPPPSSAATVASYVAAGLGAARDAPGHPTTGVVWLDGGTAGSDPAVWSSLASAGAWSMSSFIATSIDAAGSCSSPDAFAATAHRFPATATLPIVSEAVQAPAPALWVAADYSCLKRAVGRAPVASMGMWRVWEGPVPR